MANINWRGVVAEFIATAIFCFIGISAIVASKTGMIGGTLVHACLAHGFGIVALVYATANVSGGHINPCVTLAMLVTGNIDAVNAALYMLAQFTGGVVGAAWLWGSVSDADHELADFGAHVVHGVTAGQAISLEFVATFLLVFVIFSTAVDKEGMGNAAPLAIGLCVMIDILAIGPFTGASMNTARSFAPALIKNSHHIWKHNYVYWIGPPLGAMAAGLVQKHVFFTRDTAGHPSNDDKRAVLLESNA